MKKFLVVCFVLFVIVATLAVGSAVALYMWAAKDLPDIRTITDYKMPLVTTVYARDGEVLGYFYREKRFLVTLDEMPEHLPLAFLAAEDSAFFEHEGVDLTAIMRAFIKNLSSGEIRQGGSTITQQIIKRLLLSSERSYKRKLKEAILAYRLERYLTKEEILTIYLNQIYLGAHSYGVEAAARAYFGKHVGELTLAESAVLAGLPQAPSSYDPYRYPEAAKGRQEYVLEQMFKQGWITRAQYEEAVAQPLIYKAMPDISWRQGAYYLEEVRRWLVNYLSEDNMHAQGIELDRYGEDAAYELGLHVYTAVDLTHQAAAERAVREGLEANSKRRGWQGPLEKLEPSQFEEFLTRNPVSADSLEPGSWVKVLVVDVTQQGATVRFGDYQGYMDVATMHWCRTPNPRLASENVPAIRDARDVVAVGDVVWASALPPAEAEEGAAAPAAPADGMIPLAIEQKPEIQGALVSLEPPTGEVRALVGGYSFEDSQFNRATQAARQPGSAFKPIVYSAALDNGFTAASIVLDAPFVYEDPYTHRVWRPSNFSHDFSGPTILRTALVKSKNLVTIRVAQQIGVEQVVARAKALGLDPEFPAVLAISLGSVAVTPIDLAGAYTAFARGGSTIEPRFVLRVTQAWGGDMYVSEPQINEVLSPQNAYIMCSLLKEVVQSGTGYQARQLGRPVAGKTGTTNDEQDAWFMGFSPYLLTAVYVGFDELQPMGRLETGGRVALPLWLAYRQAVEDNYPVQDFPVPPGIVFAQVNAATGGLAGPGAGETYYLPFMAGTEPTSSQGQWVGDSATGDGQGTAEDLFREMF